VTRKIQKLQHYAECGCGWYRDITESPTWKSKVIHHPVYGKVTNISAANWDVVTHTCESYREALAVWSSNTGKTNSTVATSN